MNLVHDFTYHPPQGDQVERYQEIRSKALEFAEFLVRVTPTSRAQTHAINKLHEVVFWANAAIARGEEPFVK